MKPTNTRTRGDAATKGALLAWLSRQQDEMAGLLADLVAIPTENPQGINHRACAEFLETRLRERGLECQRLQPTGQAANSEQGAADIPVSLLASYGRGDRTLYF